MERQSVEGAGERARREGDGLIRICHIEGTYGTFVPS